MLIPILISGLIFSMIFGGIRYFELKQLRKKEQAQKKELSRKLYELGILGQVSEKIGYSLSSRDIAQTISQTAESLFEVSSVSFATIENDHIEFVTTTHEKVGPSYLHGVKEIVLSALYGIDDPLRQLPVIEKAVGVHILPHNDILEHSALLIDTLPMSYFNIPLVLNNRLTGMINIASYKKGVYQDEDMSMLYKIVNQAQVAIGRLERVIETEKGKVEALIKSLSSGAAFFALENNRLKLFTINNAAKRFLHLEGNLDLVKVLGSFNLTPNIISEMKDVIVIKKSSIYRNVDVFGNHFNIYITPVFSKDEEHVIGVALTMQDITLEKESQKLKESFQNIIVHELRAPLTAIKNASTLLGEGKLSDEEEVEMRQVIRTSSERLLQDINELLDSAKIDSKKMDLILKENSISETIDKALETMSYTAKTRSILIEKRLDVHIPAFMFDSERMEQVLVNLLSNSIKFNKDEGKVTVSTRMDVNDVVLEVADTGTGIPESKMSVLFTPFSQFSNGKRAQGTGLGLYIAKTIVESHGGHLAIESSEGSGTTVTVRLPLHTASNAVSQMKVVN